MPYSASSSIPPRDASGYYRVFDAAAGRLDVSTVPEFWWSSWVGPDQTSVGVEYNGVQVLTRLPHGFAGISNMTVGSDAMAWWTVGTVDPDATPADQVDYYLGRTDIACGASVIAEIDFSGLSELATHSMVADESGVFVVDIGDNYRLLRYELPPPPCGEQHSDG